MRTAIYPPRAAFTLIELLVVIAIIGVLLALLLPAVQKVREAANRMTCQSQLRQIALATHSYHDAQGHFPVDSLDAYGPESHAWSWLARILPYVEQDNLYRQGNIPNNTLYQSRDVVAAQIKLFLCPATALPPPGHVQTPLTWGYTPARFSRPPSTPARPTTKE